MAIYVFAKDTGELRAYCPNDDGQVAPADVLEAKGYDVVSGLEPQDDTHEWDAATRSVKVVPAPIRPRIIDAYQFILSFTPEEFDAIQKSPDARVRLLFAALQSVGTIDLNGKTTQQGLGYLVLVGLLAQDRMNTILAGPQ